MGAKRKPPGGSAASADGPVPLDRRPPALSAACLARLLTGVVEERFGDAQASLPPGLLSAVHMCHVVWACDGFGAAVLPGQARAKRAKRVALAKAGVDVTAATQAAAPPAGHARAGAPSGKRG